MLAHKWLRLPGNGGELLSHLCRPSETLHCFPTKRHSGRERWLPGPGERLWGSEWMLWACVNGLCEKGSDVTPNAFLGFALPFPHFPLPRLLPLFFFYSFSLSPRHFFEASTYLTQRAQIHQKNTANLLPWQHQPSFFFFFFFFFCFGIQSKKGLKGRARMRGERSQFGPAQHWW